MSIWPELDENEEDVMMPTSKESDIQSGVDPVSFSGVHPSNYMEYTPNLAQENISLSNTASTPSFLHAEQITPNSATLSGTDAAVLTANLETALPGLRPLDLPASAATQAEQELTFIRGFVDSTSQWSYRIPFAIQWAIGLPILVTVAFAPESPWWLIRHRRQHDAKRSLTRLTRKDEIHIDQTVAMMEHTNEIEKYLKEDDGGMSYLDAFKGVDRRRTEIACMVWIAQQVCGTSLMGWATTFYEQAGFSVDDAFNLSLGVYGLGIVGAVISWSVLLPETFGLSYLEIDILFERNAKTSKFRELRMNLESSGYFGIRNFLGETDVWRRY
ncbi:hypothetical protein PoHVEF18_008992 [Penicillium ochrochloron]